MKQKFEKDELENSIKLTKDKEFTLNKCNKVAKLLRGASAALEKINRQKAETTRQAF